jgi:hypothetical protein
MSCRDLTTYLGWQFVEAPRPRDSEAHATRGVDADIRARLSDFHSEIVPLTKQPSLPIQLKIDSLVSSSSS